MLRLILPVLLLLLGVGGGVGAGLFLTGGNESRTEFAADDHGGGEHAGDEHGVDDGHEDDTGGGADDGHGNETGNSNATEFVRLNNQFVVPIVRHGSVRSLVVMSLTIEVDNGQNSAVFNQETPPA